MRFCRHCGREIFSRGGNQHEASCPDNPVIAAAVAAAIADPEHPGFARSKVAYTKLPRTPIGAEMLVAKYGSWDATVRRFGLRPASELPTMERNCGGRPSNWGMEPLSDAERHACARRGVAEFDGTQGVHSHWHAVDVW
jgi:hypothetical protein